MRTVKTALDNHLRTSSNVKPIANRAVKVARERLGEGAVIGVVNYNPNEREEDPRWKNFVGGLRYDKVGTGNGVYLPELDLLAIRGQEVPRREGGDLLFFGLPERISIPNHSSTSEALRIAESYGALKIAAAPYHDSTLGKDLEVTPELAADFDGIETHSGEACLGIPFTRLTPFANRKAQKLFRMLRHHYNPDLFEFIGDDGHSLYEIGRSWGEIKLTSDYNDFRDNPEKLNSDLRLAHQNRMKRSELREKRSKLIGMVGALDHMADLATIITLSKLR